MESPAGKYAITCHGAAGADYTISYKTGYLTVRQEAVKLTFDGDRTVTHGESAHFTATLKSARGEAVSGRTLKLSIGSGQGQTCTTGATDSKGNAGCTISDVQAPAGKRVITVSFSGDKPGKNDDYAAGHASDYVMVLQPTRITDGPSGPP